jgi:K+-transporting ATPase ATPase C chain
MVVVTIVLTGFIYPAVVWGISSVVFPKQAGGSLVTDSSGSVIGSRLIAQPFTADKYFHPRASAAGADGYDAMSSSASNLGPTSQVLVSAVESRVAEIQKSDRAEKGTIPVDAVTASASGLDPDITPDNAEMQVARVARARRLQESQVRELVAANTTLRQLGILGEPRVSVLELNLALDAVASK